MSCRELLPFTKLYTNRVFLYRLILQFRICNFKRFISWNIMLFSPLQVNRNFRGICRLDFQSRTVSQTKKPAWKQVASRVGFHPWLILRSWRRRRYAPTKQWLIFNRLHDVIFSITTAVYNSYNDAVSWHCLIASHKLYRMRHLLRSRHSGQQPPLLKYGQFSFGEAPRRRPRWTAYR
jgi:hypothetical protein